MLTFFILLLTVPGLVYIGVKALLRTLMDTCGTLMCYLGAIVFISLTFIHTIPSNVNKTPA
ncbi:MAG: hypothetical protein ACI965_000351 [Paraglaciecola sp.]|jgi:hypothetical protein